jgi:hypothetical protein
MTLRAQLPPLGLIRHRDIRSAVQTHGVAIFVHEFDAIDASRAPRRAADFVHQLEQYAGIDLGGSAQARLDSQMEHRESLVGRADEDRHAHGSAEVGNGEQSLYSGDVADTDAQAPILLVDLGHPVCFNGLLDPVPHTMLVDVEEQQLFQRGTLVYRQF